MMHKQLLAIMVATMLALAMAFIGPTSTSIAIAEEEEPKPEPTITEIVEIFNAETSEAVGDIIDESPTLSDSIEATAGEVAASNEVKPEIIEAVGEVSNEVSNAETPSDIIVTLDPGVTENEVLMTLGTLNDTSILEAATTTVVTNVVIANDPELVEAFNVELCNTVNTVIINGTDVTVALEELPGNIEAIVEAEVTPAEVAAAEASVTSGDVITAIESGEVDLATSVGEAAADELEVVITPVPDPTPDPTDPTPATSVEERLDRIETTLERISDMIATDSQNWDTVISLLQEIRDAKSDD